MLELKSPDIEHCRPVVFFMHRQNHGRDEQELEM